MTLSGLPPIWRRRKWSGLILILVGAGLFVYGILNFNPSGSTTDSPLIGGSGPYGYSYGTEARLEAAIGSVLVVAGCLLHRSTDRRT